jgi:hypothetical protein
LGSAAVLTLGAAYAYHALSQRPGESGLRFVPSDAFGVLSLDLSPSPGQALTFKRIDDALARNGMDGVLQKSLVDVLFKSKLSEDIKPYALRAGSGALLPGDGPNAMQNPGALMFISLTDGKAVDQILGKNLYPQFYKGFRYYKLNSGTSVVAVMDDQLAFAPNIKCLYEAHEVAVGASPSILSLADFQQARAQVASDANIVFLGSPKIAEAFGTKSAQISSKTWMAGGIAVREDGLAIDISGKMDFDANPILKEVAENPPIRKDLFNVLPSGAYGVISTSGLSSYGKAFKNAFQQAGAKDDLDESLHKSLGIDFQQDVLPAFKGDAVVAAYPGDENSTSGLSFLIVVDDQNGADPSALASKLEAWADKQIHADSNAPKDALFNGADKDGARIYKLSDPFQSQMTRSVDDGLKSAPVKPGISVGRDTITWATVGHTVLISTSHDLLDRAIDTYQHGTNSLASDTTLVGGAAKAIGISQMLATFDVSRIAKGVEGTIVTDKMNPNDQTTYHQVLSLFDGLKQPLQLLSSSRPDGSSTGSFFIPIDYDKTIDLIASKTKQTGK